MSSESTFRFRASRSAGEVSARLVRPDGARWLFLMAHGAGAGMDHRFMVAASGRFAASGIATARYQFPYMEAGRRRPDPGPLLVATVRSAVEAAAERAPDLPIVAGGKSMGGRMTSLAASTEPLPGVAGLVFLGFPLHPAGKPATERAEHLAAISVPMLFLQGTRDRLADLELFTPICERLGRLATLAVVDGADHSFAVLERSGRSEEEVLDELVETTVEFLGRLESS